VPSWNIRRRGFTLVEILVVIGIIGILMALLLPAIQQSRESARQGQCKSQLRQLGLAVMNHHDVHGQFPPGWTGKSEVSQYDVIGPTGWGWSAHLLPFIEQNNLASRIALDWYMLHPANDVARSQAISLYVCPSDIPSEAMQLSHHGTALYELPKSNYVANFGVGQPTECDQLAFTGKQCDGGRFRGPFYHNSEIDFADLAYGSSNTVLIGERSTARETRMAPGTWTGAGPGLRHPFARILGTSGVPLNDDSSVEAFRSWHPGGVLFAYADAHVELLREGIDETVFAQTTSIDLIDQSLEDDDSTGTSDDTTGSGDGGSDPPWGISPPGGSGDGGVCPICNEETPIWWIHVEGLEGHVEPAASPRY